ncbi:hypothetical protein [Achromobacter insuavis]|uniref:Uncharacterized protein n=1 Tax=Achromobacter insuavis AXX-A TaxID=1003200 RepID=F7T9E1_9BURK|nr:hypothetical protein [Achromobacter insuavis]EGP43101.1 hypothetical protein AXXA_27935 [Achromobacter insuavis AXX-A]
MSFEQTAYITLQAVHLVGPFGCVDSQVSIFRVARCKTSDPVGAGFIRSAAGSGIRGITAGGAEHAVKLSTGSSQASFRSLARQDGTTVLGISTVFLQLVGLSDGALGGLGADAFLGDAVGLPAGAVQHDASAHQESRGSADCHVR